MFLRHIFFLFVFLNVYSQKENTDSSIFIFTRSSESKVNFIAKDFNLSDTLSTHIGIGFKSKESFVIFNVDNVKKLNNSSLIIENLESFINSEEINYYSIWEYKTSIKEYNLLLNELERFKDIILTFDYNFELKNDNNYYCSEFVSKVLFNIDNEKYNYSPKEKKLIDFYERNFKKSKLTYIPVDFFLSFNLFIKVDEKYTK